MREVLRKTLNHFRKDKIDFFGRNDSQREEFGQLLDKAHYSWCPECGSEEINGNNKSHCTQCDWQED